MKKRYIVLLVFSCIVLMALGYGTWKNKQEIEYSSCLQETAFTANGEKIKMSALGFYILYEEGEIEKQAQIYNPDNTKDYWNLRMDGKFVQSRAKDNIMNMAIHDMLFYQEAVKKQLALDGEEEKIYRNVVSDFWMDLLDIQLEKMPLSEEFVIESLRKKALAEKYQKILAEKNKKSFAAYDCDGYAYEEWLKKQDVKINDKIWKRIPVGDITLEHGTPNYINGQDKKESE